MHISVLHTHTHTDKDGCVRERACMHAHAQAHATRCDDHDNAHPASASIHPSDTHTPNTASENITQNMCMWCAGVRTHACVHVYMAVDVDADGTNNIDGVRAAERAPDAR